MAFDGWGKMEVDLLDEETRLVIELDGGQHFANEDAYRRDRRKDAVLQEHGYFVLRFWFRILASNWIMCWIRFSEHWHIYVNSGDVAKDIVVE